MNACMRRWPPATSSGSLRSSQWLSSTKYFEHLGIEAVSLVQRYFGTAVGKNKQAAKTEIERLKLEDMTCQQGVLEVAKM